MKHRTDIDGLRAVAVLPVVAYHAGLSQFPGGFVGVDVFFVISGYLITGIVAGELSRTTATGKSELSLVGFYERRIRRIFPALFAMLALTAVAVSLLLTPAEVIDYAWTMLAAVFSGSNVLFWLDTNYFEQAAHQKPLLHTWSLAVEEQFYLLMPIALLLLWRLRPAGKATETTCAQGTPRRIKIGLWAIAIVSFLWSWWGSQHQPTASFYLLHTRAWELALGALLAVGAVPTLSIRWLRELVAGVGLVAIGGSVLLLTAETPFPGIAALAPCLGTAALLHAGAAGPTGVGQLLSVRPARFFGLISYSLYLWHWPVIVLQRATFVLGEGLDPKIEKGLMIAVSIMLAWISYKLVEQPFRGRSWLSPRGRWLNQSQIYWAGGFGAIALVALSVLLISFNGFPGRMSALAGQTASYLTQSPLLTMKHPTCMAGIGLRDRVDTAKCLAPIPGSKNVLLLGDSHAAHLWSGLAAALPEVNLLQATAGGCRPTWPSKSQDAICHQLLSDIYGERLRQHPPDLVILAARWEPKDVPALTKTLTTFRQLGVPVVVLGPVPRYDQELPRLLIAAEQRSDPTLPQRHRMGLAAKADHQLARVTSDNGVPYVSIYSLLCGSGACQTRTPEGEPLQYDGGHLTAQGSAYVGSLVRPQLTAISSTPQSNQR